MKTLTAIAQTLTFGVLLSACTSIGITSDSTSIKQVREVTLADGTVTRVGFRPVENDWQCSTLDKQTSNAGMNKIRGTVSFGGPFQVMADDAVDYANDKHLKPNYIYLHVPTEVAVGQLDSSVFSNAESTYYQCAIVPEIRDSITSLFN